MKEKRIITTITALAMSCAMLNLPVFAAQFQGNPVLTYQAESEGIALEVDGLLKGENVYAVQLTLELNGAYPDAGLVPHESYVQAENKVVEFGQKTELNVYLDAQAPINNDTELRLGYLNLDRVGALPSQAKLVLLDKDLDRTDAVVSVLSAGGSSEGNHSSGEDSELAAPAKVEHTGRGSVKVTPTRAAVGSKVTVTAVPDTGYEVASITVLDNMGRTVQVTTGHDNQFTFIQPKGGPVQIQVNFQQKATDQPAMDFPFQDIQETDWCFAAVSHVYEKGLMAGTSATTFSPNKTTTRGMIVTILHRMEGKPTASGEGFQDVPAGQYYSDAVLWAASHGIVNGYENGNFGPNDPINRAQMAAILYRYATYKGYDVTERANLGAFRDADKISSYATEALSWGNACGLINGVGNGMLNPLGNATRAQVATILMRFDEKVVQ